MPHLAQGQIFQLKRIAQPFERIAIQLASSFRQCFQRQLDALGHADVGGQRLQGGGGFFV